MALQWGTVGKVLYMFQSSRATGLRETFVFHPHNKVKKSEFKCWSSINPSSRGHSNVSFIYDLMATVGYDRCEGKKRTDGSGQLMWNDEMKPDFSPGTNARFSETEWVAAKWGMAASRLRVLSEGFHYKNCSSAFRRNYCSNSTSFISIFAILEHNCSERGQFRTNSCCSDEGKQRTKRKRTIK